jgi:oxidase EvaA
MNTESLFLKSLLTLKNPFNSFDEIVKWLDDRNQAIKVNVEMIPFRLLDNWLFDQKTHNLRHKTGKFFSIDGLMVKKDSNFSAQWCQPLINQPEVGYLGIITKEYDGILYFLMQAKIEPGNVNCVQLSPTLQATKSNYTQTHSGKAPKYLEYFQYATQEQILVDQLQSEQGARFLRKRNRNMIIKIHDDIEVYEDFCWLTLGQIKKLILHDNLVNMDSRTVISCITFSDQNLIREHASSEYSSFGHDLLLSSMINAGKNSMNSLLSWLCSLKSMCNLLVDHIPLNEVNDWIITENEIYHKDNKYFKIIGVNVHIENREVKEWCQPIVKPMEHGICAFLIKKIYGTYHFLVQAKFECGNFDMYEFAPTIQCLQSELLNKSNNKHFFINEVNNAPKENIIIDTYQSEEGGRFYKEQNRNMLIKVDENFPEELPTNYAWMTLGQLNSFLKYNNFVNIQARSILSALQYKKYE